MGQHTDSTDTLSFTAERARRTSDCARQSEGKRVLLCVLTEIKLLTRAGRSDNKVTFQAWQWNTDDGIFDCEVFPMLLAMGYRIMFNKKSSEWTASW